MRNIFIYFYYKISLSIKYIVIFSLTFFFTHTHASENNTLSKENITISTEQAEVFGKILINYKGRIAPLQTFAQDFTIKITGKPSYKYANTVQVLSGWLFFPDSWQKVPVFEIKSREMRIVLGIQNKHACAKDFFDTLGNYKLAPYYPQMYQTGNQTPFIKEALQLNEKLQLIKMLQYGTLLKIFPCNQAGQILWTSPNDIICENITKNDALFIHNFFPLYYAAIIQNQSSEATELLYKLSQFQHQNAGHTLPSATKQKLEIFYNQSHAFSWLFMINLGLGIISIIFFIISILRNVQNRIINMGIFASLILAFVVLTFFLVIRSYIAGYWTLSNGFETMIFMAWCSLLISIILCKISSAIPAFGLLISGFTLLAAHLSNMNPQITPLVPVLVSPLLSIHVSLIMISYSLVGFLTLSSLSYLLIILFTSKVSKQTELILKKLQVLSQIMLYPCAFFLGVGIFVGAIWANVSWGRYWGWDPKEVWALITFIIISLSFHRKTFHIFKKPLFFHSYIFLTLGSVLMTYFGVNYFLGGMHSYAGNEGQFINYTVIGSIFLLLMILILIAHRKIVRSQKSR